MEDAREIERDRESERERGWLKVAGWRGTVSAGAGQSGCISYYTVCKDRVYDILIFFLHRKCLGISGKTVCLADNLHETLSYFLRKIKKKIYIYIYMIMLPAAVLTCTLRLKKKLL